MARPFPVSLLLTVVVNFASQGLLVSSGQVEPCNLTFYLFGTPQSQQRVVFTGLTAEERDRSGNSTTGWRLTCACLSNRRLTPLQWLDVNGEVLPKNDRDRPIDFKVAYAQPGSAVNLRIHGPGFSCAEAGNYTCVVGSNTRTALVTPIGDECGPTNVVITTSPPGPVSSGTNLTLYCSADDPTQSGLTFQWLKNGAQITGELSPILMLTEVGPTDGGNYTCQVSNKMGQGEAGVTVEVLGVFSTPEGVVTTTVEYPTTTVEYPTTTVEPLSTPGPVEPASGSVRLVNGAGPHEGRVEIFYNGTWSTVCDNFWSRGDALVVCRQLGYPGVLHTHRNAHFGEGSGPIWFDNLLCTGDEDNLTQCLSGYVDCDHSEDAGVTCAREASSSIVQESTASTAVLPSATSVPLSTPMEVSSTPMEVTAAPMETRTTIVQPTSTPVEPASGSVRLVNGAGPHEGRVEIFYNGTWGTVCDNFWSKRDAMVVCRQLGYHGLKRPRHDAHFGEGTGPILFENLRCRGSEGNLTQCRIGGGVSESCTHSEDAGVTCATELVSLSSATKKPTASTSVLPSTTSLPSSSPGVINSTSSPAVTISTPIIPSSIPVAVSTTPVVAPSSTTVPSSAPPSLFPTTSPPVLRPPTGVSDNAACSVISDTGNTTIYQVGENVPSINPCLIRTCTANGSIVTIDHSATCPPPNCAQGYVAIQATAPGDKCCYYLCEPSDVISPADR